MKLGNLIPWKEYCRDTAIIITNEGKVYQDINHQYCLELFAKEYFKEAYSSAENENDLDEWMMEITDKLFREGTFHGFDLFLGRNGEKVFASHYKGAFNNATVDRVARDYAKKNGCKLATFFNPDKLGKELAEIVA